MIKLVKLLKENQVLDFNRPELHKVIQKYINLYSKNSNPSITTNVFDNEERLASDDLRTVVYDILRNSYQSKVNNHKLFGFTDEEFNAWRNYFKSKPFITDGVWSQYDINTQNKNKVDGKTYNYYVTLEKSKENLLNFYRSIYKLASKLLEVSKKYNNSAISFKTTLRLDAAVTENDNLKIYFYDKNLENDVEKAFKEWTSENNIKISTRTHTKGVDVAGKSFGVMLSKLMSDRLVSAIQKDVDKYTPKQYADWLEKYTPTIINSILIK
jgi:hypothetical protein